MTSLSDRYEYAIDNTFRVRVKMALIKTALDVAAETAGSDAALATARKALSAAVLKAPTAWTDVISYAVACDPAIATGSSDPLTDDDALTSVVVSVWDAYADTFATS